MTRMSKLLNLLSTFFIISIFVSASAWSRKPAVQPVSGISIEGYNDVPAKKAKGFNWEQKTGRKIRRDITSQQSPVVHTEKESHSAIPTSLLLAILVFTPFIIWLAVMRKTYGKGEESLINEYKNIANLAEEKERRQQEKEDINYPKAS